MIIDQKAFVEILSDAARIAPPANSIEISRCVVLSAAEGLLTVRATDFTLWITQQVPCDGGLAPIAVHAARLLDVVSRMRSGSIVIDLDGDRLILREGRGAKRSLPTLSAATFPSPQPLENELSIGLDAAKFAAGIEFVRPFVSDDLTKPGMCGVHLHSHHGAIRCVGAFRGGVAYAEVGSALAEFAITLPPAFLAGLARSLPDSGPFFLVATDRGVEAAWPGGSIRSPLIDSGFPDYERAVPTTAERATLRVNANELVEAIHSARGLGHDDKAGGSTIVSLRMNGSVEVVALSDKGEAIEPVDAEFSGDPLTIGLMSGQVVKGLGSLNSSPMSISFGDAVTPVIFRSGRHPDRLAVLAPVRI